MLTKDKINILMTAATMVAIIGSTIYFQNKLVNIFDEEMGL